MKKTAEEILKNGLRIGRYDNITSNPDIDIKLPFYQDIILFANDFASYTEQDECDHRFKDPDGTEGHYNNWCLKCGKGLR